MSPPAQNPTSAALSLHDIHMQFGGVTALHNISYDIPRTIIQGVIGPNGAGKSTLFNCITGVLQPTSGRVVYEDVVLNGKPPHKIARLGISRTFQHVALFNSMTVLENVMLGRHPKTKSGFWATGLRLPGMPREERLIREKALHFLDFVGLSGESNLPAGSLPLGKQKILEIARALATEPQLLLLDEPAGGLNMRETEDLGELIQEICGQGITVMLVEHDMNLIMEISHRILVLHYGEALASGTPREIKDNPQVIEAYLGEE